MLVATTAGALCGLVPALRHARLDPIEALQSGSRRLATGRDSPRRLRRVMVFAEVALCMALLVTSGLLVCSALPGCSVWTSDSNPGNG